MKITKNMRDKEAAGWMVQQIVPLATWRAVESLFPALSTSRTGGRPQMANHKALAGILFVLKTGIAWEALPSELGCGCGRTCFRRLVAWQIAQAWPQVERTLRDTLPDSAQIDWGRAVEDAAIVKAIAMASRPRPRRASSKAASSASDLKKASR